MNRSFNETTLSRFRELPSEDVLAALSEHMKADTTYIPVKDATSRRWHVHTTVGDFEILTTGQANLRQLRQQLNELRGYVVQIAINAHRMGLQPELLLSLAQREITTAGALNSDRLIIQYLSGIGLLTRLDKNVRGLAR